MNADPLESLVVERDAIARDELAAGLSPFIRFDREGGLWPSDAFDGLTGKRKVACILLALKAQHLLGLREKEGAAPAEVVEASRLPAGTVRPALAALAKERLASKAGADYVIPDPMSRKAVELIARESR